MNPRVGKYILDSLSIGMYSHPLMLIREYIQNSTDAIDEAVRGGILQKDRARIDIKIDGSEKSLSIRDNGAGVSIQKSWAVFHDIGKSTKKLTANRGFRGIGRLGGLGYCDVLRFTTKSAVEDQYSIGTWNCSKLRQLIKEENQFDTLDVIKTATDFQHATYQGSRSDHYFEVYMHHLQSSREVLLNVPLIRAYVSEVAPVPYKKNRFAFADKIEKELKKRVPRYETYNIFVNGEQIYKPYADQVLLRGDKRDKVQEIEFIEFKTDNAVLAFGWRAKLRLLGSISTSSLVSGIRVRGGNILIGDKDLLNGFFRESRFNSYLLGEIFTIDERLIPNSRRDDFEDNLYREEFYDQFIRNMGLPLSKTIRQNSQERSRQKALEKDMLLMDQAKNMISSGYLAEGQKRWVIGGLTRLKEKNHHEQNIDDLILKVSETKHFLDMNGRNGKHRFKDELRAIAEIVYRDSEDKNKAVRLINRIISAAG